MPDTAPVDQPTPPAPPVEAVPSTATEPCPVCPDPIVLGDLHVTFAQLFERQSAAGDAYVEHAQVICYLHPECAVKVGNGDLVIPPRPATPAPAAEVPGA